MNKQRFFALCGVIAPLLFAVIVILASILRPEYSQTHNFISDLGVGSDSLIQNLNFLIFGILCLLFGWGLRTAFPTPQKRSLKVGVWLVIIFAFCMMLAGVFPENYLSQVPHNLVSATAFLTIIAAQLLIWKGLKNADKLVWGKYRKYSLISGLLSIVFLLVLRVTILAYVDYQGAVQRLFLAVPWIWIMVTGIKLYFRF